MKILSTTPTDTQLQELGRRLAAYRKYQGYSQHQLAEQAGVGVASVRRIEGGQDAQLGTWVKLLRALDASELLDSLLPEEIRSPMADVKQARKKRPTKAGASSAGVIWGDEQDEGSAL